MINQIKKQKILKCIFLLLTVFFIGFIFSRSLMPSETSSTESTDILSNLSVFLNSIGINIPITDYIVRKAAHFIEFMCFGISLTITLNLYKPKIKNYIFLDLFLIIFIPLCDEGLQYFSNGRSPEVKDVFIDFLGALTGLILVLLIILIVKAIIINKKKNNK